jgi:periplasmic divalent cation tolerance protein
MIDNNSEYGIVLTTVGSEAQGQEIANMLLQEKLAACINIFPVESFYTWQGEINRDREWQLIIKTRLKVIAEITKKIQSIHDYEVPEIIVLPIIKGSHSQLVGLVSSFNGSSISGWWLVVSC